MSFVPRRMSRLLKPARLGLALLATIGVPLAQAQGASTPAMSRAADAAAPSSATSAAANGAGTPVTDATLRANLESRIGAPIDAITRLPLAGLYEVRIGNDVFYTDPSGNYIMVGNIIDTRTKENLTRTRIEAIKQASLPPFKFAELPFDEAVKVVKGNGRRRVAIFEDPNCGYCKKLEKSILDIGDVTIYVFLYPVLGPDSLVKSRQVWCSADRAKAWSAWMQGATALAGDGACTTPLDKTLQLGRKLRVEGTPTLFFPNNKRVEGAIEAEDLEKMLAG